MVAGQKLRKQVQELTFGVHRWCRRCAQKKSSKKQILKFTIDCTVLVNDELLDTASFEKFLGDRIKVNGKAGQLGDAGASTARGFVWLGCAHSRFAFTVKLSRDTNKVFVAAAAPFSKRYLKYLTKKYLKSFQLRDYLHVIASDRDRNAYEVSAVRLCCICSTTCVVCFVRRADAWCQALSDRVCVLPAVFQLRYFKIGDDN